MHIIKFIPLFALCTYTSANLTKLLTHQENKKGQVITLRDKNYAEYLSAPIRNYTMLVEMTIDTTNGNQGCQACV